MHSFGPTFTNPGMVALLNATYYNHSLPTLNLSWPVVRMAGVITLNGQYNTNGAFFTQAYAFMVDMINAKGGVPINGVQHLVSITYASDDSSLWALQYLYSVWMNDPSYTLYLFPGQDAQLVALNPLFVGSNRTLFNFLACDKEDFTAHYPYIWTLITTRDLIPGQILSQINARAQQYHGDVSSGAVTLSYQGETTSAWGVKSVCLYTHSDRTQNLSAAGVRQWINGTNQARLAGGASVDDLIVLEQDVLWSIDPTAIDQTLYTNTFDLCPDHVDVLVVCGESSPADAAAVGAALAASELRPKAAFTASTQPSYTSLSQQLASQWPGWLTYGSNPPQAPTLASPTFDTLAQYKRDWSTYYNVTTTTNLVQLFPSGLDIAKAALATATTLTADGLRAAFLNMTGKNTYVRSVGFNARTGTNDLSVSTASQIDQHAGLVAVANVSQILYPYDWPWSRLQVGDSLRMSQVSTTVIVGWVLIMLGCWVAQVRPHTQLANTHSACTPSHPLCTDKLTSSSSSTRLCALWSLFRLFWNKLCLCDGGVAGTSCGSAWYLCRWVVLACGAVSGPCRPLSRSPNQPTTPHCLSASASTWPSSR